MYLVRIRPYRTLDNVIDGVVLTFTDITSRVSLEAGVEEARKVADAIIDTVHHPLMVLDDALHIVSVNRAFYRYFAMEEKNTIGHSIGEVATLQWNLPQLRELLEEVLEMEGSLEGYEVEREVPGGGLQTMRLNARPLSRKDLSTRQLLVAFEVPDTDTVKRERP
jgi:two-component system CheB/CheR fusion protein